MSHHTNATNYTSVRTGYPQTPDAAPCPGPGSLSTPGRFEDWAVVVGSPPARSFMPSPLSLAVGVTTAASMPGMQHARVVERRRAQSDATAFFSDSRAAFRQAEESAFHLIAHYRNNHAGGPVRGDSVAGQRWENGPKFARILAQFEATLQSAPDTATASLVRVSTRLLNRIMNGAGRLDAKRVDVQIHVIEARMAELQSARNIRQDAGFRSLFPAHDAPEADKPLRAMSSQMLIDYGNAASYLHNLLAKSDRSEIEAFATEIRRHATHAAAPVLAGTSGPIAIPLAPDRERGIAKSCLSLIEEDAQFIASFAVGRKQNVEVDAEDMLLAVAEAVVDHARTLLPADDL